MFHRHVVFIIASSIGLIASPMFAQSSNDSCAACDNTPNIIQSYYQFVTKATAIMGDDYKESAVSPGAPFVGQFLSRNLTLSNSNTLATIFRNQQTRLNENLTFLANTARVTGKTALGTLDNRTRSMASWFNIALKRDIDKIASLDSQIDNVTLALGRAGLTDRNLASDTRNELVQLIGGLSPTIFDKTSQIPIDTTYGNIITIINHMQAQIKDGLINTNNPQAVKKQFSA
ncbi:MAG: hypothetical protein H6766_07280 [Candidatus Peribacteria bacterium]|nr:MAG: hypothetical protein H6766_07280 [Candidatus Peribacteria bacterium]